MPGLIDRLLGRRRRGGAAVAERPPVHPERETPSPDARAAQHNRFANALFGKLMCEKGNVFFSPWSVRTALAMAYAGAHGETARQMERVLELGISESDAVGGGIHEALRRVTERLQSASAGEQEVTSANSLWRQEGRVLREEFSRRMIDFYGGEIHSVDFFGATREAERTINRWVEEKTRKRIRDLIPTGGLTTETRLVLANAVYFLGKWLSPFRSELTSPRPFYLERDEPFDVAMMMHPEEEFRYASRRGVEVVELDYEGEKLAMTILLPTERDGLIHLEKRLAREGFDRTIGRLEPTGLILSLPRFELAWGATDLTDALVTLGMPLAFDGSQADFSGMDGLKPGDDDALFLSKVFHKAYVKVDEQGTEAAAATAACTVGAAQAIKMPRIVCCDHPFLFVIRDLERGLVLFAGRVADPRG